jgi:hypothetical protein
MKQKIKILISYSVFTIILLVLSHLMSKHVYRFCDKTDLLIFVNAFISIITLLVYLDINDDLLKLGFYFLAKMFRIGVSIICAIILLKSNICANEPVYFHTLFTYLLYLTFEITMLLTNLRPVSRE